MNSKSGRTIRWGVLLVCALAASAPMCADTLRMDGVNGVGYGGYYVSPYNATNLTPDPDRRLLLYCLDFNHRVSVGQTWQADIRPLGEGYVSTYQYGGGTSGFVFDPGGLGIFDRYLAAAWLFSRELNVTDARPLGVNQYAAWMLFVDTAHKSQFETALNKINSPEPGTGDTFQSDVAQALAEAVNNRNSVDQARWMVVTPVPAGQTNSVQEFLTPVPEPSSTALLLVVMVAAAGIQRWNAARAR